MLTDSSPVCFSEILSREFQAKAFSSMNVQSFRKQTTDSQYGIHPYIQRAGHSVIQAKVRLTHLLLYFILKGQLV